tara:strand:- start:16 stop:765 length:750 start_codon:yes stop_codon:yes gene_type:complete
MPDISYYESYERVYKRRHEDDPRPAPKVESKAKSNSPKKKMGFFRKVMTGLALSGAAAYGYGAYETQDIMAPAEATAEGLESAWNAPMTQTAVQNAGTWVKNAIADFNEEAKPTESQTTTLSQTPDRQAAANTNLTDIKDTAVTTEQNVDAPAGMNVDAKETAVDETAQTEKPEVDEHTPQDSEATATNTDAESPDTTSTEKTEADSADVLELEESMVVSDNKAEAAAPEPATVKAPTKPAPQPRTAGR